MAGGKNALRPEDNPKPFKKGENGGGYPKGVPNSKTRLKRLLELVQDKKNIVTGEIEKFSVIEQMDMALISKALKGDIRAYQEVLDRLEGKALQKTENENTEKVIILNVDPLGDNDTSDNSPKENL